MDAFRLKNRSYVLLNAVEAKSNSWIWVRWRSIEYDCEQLNIDVDSDVTSYIEAHTPRRVKYRH